MIKLTNEELKKIEALRMDIRRKENEAEKKATELSNADFISYRQEIEYRLHEANTPYTIAKPDEYDYEKKLRNFTYYYK